MDVTTFKGGRGRSSAVSDSRPEFSPLTKDLTYLCIHCQNEDHVNSLREKALQKHKINLKKPSLAEAKLKKLTQLILGLQGHLGEGLGDARESVEKTSSLLAKKALDRFEQNLTNSSKAILSKQKAKKACLENSWKVVAAARGVLFVANLRCLYQIGLPLHQKDVMTAITGKGKESYLSLSSFALESMKLSLPNISLIPPKETIRICVSSPWEKNQDPYEFEKKESDFRVRGFVTYPTKSNTLVKATQNGDTCCLMRMGSGSLCIVADGSGISLPARRSAEAAMEGFLLSFNETFSKDQKWTSQSLATLFIEGLKKAQLKAHNQGGLTTFLVACTAQTSNFRKLSLILSVGDCLAFVRRKDGTVQKVSSGSKCFASGENDPCGQLGALDLNRPNDWDLRNVQFSLVWHGGDGESFIIGSDGLDNLLASHQGMPPKETYQKLKKTRFSEQLPSFSKKWKNWEKKSDPQLQELDELYATYLIEQSAIQGKNPAEISLKIEETILEISQELREAVGKDPEGSEKNVYEHNPKISGKLDDVMFAVYSV